MSTSAAVHIAFNGILGPQFDAGFPTRETAVYTGLDLLNRVGASKRLSSWRINKDFESIAEKFDKAQHFLIERINPLLDEGAKPNDPRFKVALKGDSVELTGSEFALLKVLVDNAGNPDDFDPIYQGACLKSLEMRVFTPICEALSTALDGPQKAPALPEANAGATSEATTPQE